MGVDLPKKFRSGEASEHVDPCQEVGGDLGRYEDPEFGAHSSACKSFDGSIECSAKFGSVEIHAPFTLFAAVESFAKQGKGISYCYSLISDIIRIKC